MKLELKKFDISRVKDDKVVVAIGKRATGKSFVIKDLMYQHQSIPVGTVISATESSNKFFGDFVPKMFIHEQYTPGIIDNACKRQKMVMKKMNKDIQTFGKSTVDPRAFLILDDCMYDSSWTKDKNIASLFMNGRHLKMLFIISMQYPLGIGPNLRTNIDFVFILRENIVSNRRRLYEHYAGVFPTFEIFCQIMDQCTNNYECLVIDNTSTSNKLEDIVFWYKASPHGDFNCCHQHYWNLSKSIPDDEDDVEEVYDPTKFKKKSQHAIRVKKSNNRY